MQNMATGILTPDKIVVETARGLSIVGTRVTLYDILDYVQAGWPPRQIAAWLKLPAEHLQAALDYIAAHRPEVERQYQEVLRQAEEHRAYWENRNRCRQADLAARTATENITEIRTRIHQRREQIGP
jgi:uncharacterized protein (DUF433 family)